MKGIILAGGSGTRLYPMTKVISKQLLPVYDKPMIYYPLSTLMLAKIREILIITTRDDQPLFKRQLGNGENYGIHLHYEIQEEPKGLAQAFTIGEEFIEKDDCTMILGDNIFFGNNFVKMLEQARALTESRFAVNFGKKVRKEERKRFGIMELDESHENIIGVEEKPEHPKGDFAITGLYMYPNDVIKKAKLVRPSKRGELEITSINDMYLQEKRLKPCLLGGGFNWFDAGTYRSYNDVQNFIRRQQEDSEKTICCPEQIAYDNGWITKDVLLESASTMLKNEYGQFLLETAGKQLIKK